MDFLGRTRNKFLLLLNLKNCEIIEKQVIILFVNKKYFYLLDSNTKHSKSSLAHHMWHMSSYPKLNIIHVQFW